MVEEYDGKPGYIELNLPYKIYYKIETNPADINIYPNTTLNVLNLFNSYKADKYPGTGWSTGDFYDWWNDNDGCKKDQCIF